MQRLRFAKEIVAGSLPATYIFLTASRLTLRISVVSAHFRLFFVLVVRLSCGLRLGLCRRLGRSGRRHGNGRFGLRPHPIAACPVARLNGAV